MRRKIEEKTQRDTDRKLWQQFRMKPGKSGDQDCCPDAAALAAYFDHSSSAAETEFMENHLLHCRHCLDTLLILQQQQEIVCPPVAEKKLGRIYDLIVPPTSRLEQLKDFFQSLFFPLPVNPVLASAVLISVSLSGCYMGGRTGMDRQIIQDTLAAELQFDFDLLSAEEGLSLEENHEI